MKFNPITLLMLFAEIGPQLANDVSATLKAVEVDATTKAKLKDAVTGLGKALEDIAGVL